MDGVGSAGMSMAQFAQQYAVSMQKKAMDTQELAAEEILEMLPQNPSPMKGQYIDVYA